MGDMNLTAYQLAVLDTLDNLSSDHRVVVNGHHTDAINDAANDLIRWYPDLFPEHHDNDWTLGPTIVGENTTSIGDNCLVLDRLVSSDDAVTDPSLTNWANVKERIVARSLVRTIGLQNKETTVVDYPKTWDRYANEIMYYPTTRTGKTTYLRAYGLAGEVRLVAGGSTFLMHRDFDGVIVKLAASKVAMMIGQAARAIELEAQAEREIKRKFNHVAAGAGVTYIEPAFCFTRGGFD